MKGWLRVLGLASGLGGGVALLVAAVVPRRAEAAAESNRAEQDRETHVSTASGLVDYLREQEDGRIGVGLTVHAQMYFLEPRDEGFEGTLRLLRTAKAEKRRVRLTFRTFSGRILKVERSGSE